MQISTTQSAPRLESPNSDKTSANAAKSAEHFFAGSDGIGIPQFNTRQRLASANAARPLFRMQRSISQPSAGRQALPPSLNAAKAKAITPMQAAARDEVAKKFVLGTHMSAIAAACEKSHCIISFREAGEPTLEKLAFGAPAKGHDILEKTIKDGSIRKNYPPAQADTILAALKDADLLGYVGHWDRQTGALLGIYMGPAHSLGDHVTDGIYKIDIAVLDDGDSCRIDMDKFNASLAPLTAQENWRALPFTGDYDLHDMISLIGQRSTVPSNSPEEKRIIDTVNKKIAAADPQRSGKPLEYNTVRHGPQVAYVAFARERREPIVPAVAEADFPLAFIHKGEWTIVRNAEEHLAFYREIKTKMKVSWLPGTPSEPFRRSSY